MKRSMSSWSAAAPLARPPPKISRERVDPCCSWTAQAASSLVAARYPPRLIRDFGIPDHVLVSRATSARMVAPSARRVDMPIEGGFVGMVDRDIFDEWLRVRASSAGAERRSGVFERIDRDDDGTAVVCYRPTKPASGNDLVRARARAVIGADGARSSLASQEIKGAGRPRCVFAYHEIIRLPKDPQADFDARRCDVFYQGHLSPDFYAWIFPHGETASVGVGTAERAMLAVLDGSCHTPIGGHARLIAGRLHLTGLVARADGTFLLKRTLEGLTNDAERLGIELGYSLKSDTPADVFL